MPRFGMGIDVKVCMEFENCLWRVCPRFIKTRPFAIGAITSYFVLMHRSGNLMFLYFQTKIDSNQINLMIIIQNVEEGNDI